MLLAQEPKLLLVDEPAAGMTDEETHRTGELLVSLAGKHSLIVVEHDMTFVRQIAQNRKVTVLHQGTVLCEGGFDDVQANPRCAKSTLAGGNQENERRIRTSSQAFRRRNRHRWARASSAASPWRSALAKSWR